MSQDYLGEGVDSDGINSAISRNQWAQHVTKRVEIASALDLRIRAMIRPDRKLPDRNRTDEKQRYFRLLVISADELRQGYNLIVSVKYLLQQDDAWLKLYQSCWFERTK
jgi:hypothetical protein